MVKLMIMNCILMLSINLSGQTKDESGVSAATEKLRLAMINADKKTLEEMTAEGLSYGHSSGLVEGKEEFIEKIVTGKSDFVSIDLSEQTISIHGNTAIVRHIFKAATNDSGKPGEVQLKILLVWQRQGKIWKLLARQAVKFS